MIGNAPIQQGSQFKVVNHGNALIATLSSYNQPKSLRFDVDGKPMTIQATVSLREASANSTQVHAEYIITPKGIMKLPMALMAPMFKKQFVQEFDNFKKWVEAAK